MQWLISDEEPDCLLAPILSERSLRSGVVKELVKALPWHKRTPNMEALLAWTLRPILRSGFEFGYIIRQMSRLDISPGVAEDFLGILAQRKVCHFGEPRYFHSAVQYVLPHGDGMVVYSQYLNSKVRISNKLYESLRLLHIDNARDNYEKLLEEQLGGKDRADKALFLMAQQGLLLSCESAEISTSDHGPIRLSFEMCDRGELLSASDWSRRREFVEDCFGSFYFHSQHIFASSPIRLCGDARTILQNATPSYFWDLFFKFQSYSEEIPVDLNLSFPLHRMDLRELRQESPLIFKWNLQVDLTESDNAAIKELIDFVQRQRPSIGQLTVLVDRHVPPELSSLYDSAALNIYYANPPDIRVGEEVAPALRRAIQRSFRAYLRDEGCGAGSSLYIDYSGDVFTCSLEGGALLGNITDGAELIERRRQEARSRPGLACRFGASPSRTRSGAAPDFIEPGQGNQGVIAGAWLPFSCACP